MKFLDKSTALCLVPHPDDTAIGMAGLVTKYRDTTFHMIYLSTGTPTDASSGQGRMLEEYRFWRNSNARNVVTHELPYTFSTAQCVGITSIENLNIDYDIIFGPSSIDSHYEHVEASKFMMALSRFKPATVVEYRNTSTLHDWLPNMFVKLTEVEVMNKILCLKQSFLSQLDASYFSYDNLLLFHQDYISAKRNFGYCEQFKVNQLYVE